MEAIVGFKKQRDLSIDIVRCICMICIILAHVEPPSLLHTVRSFDVVGLVMISTICMKPAGSFRNNLRYIVKRIRRLVIPSYIFIVCVLLSVYFVCVYFKVPYFYDKTTIINSFLLIDGIGYVWIIRVLMINALLAPLLFKLVACRSLYLYIVGVIILFLLKVLLVHFPYKGSLTDFVFNFFVLYSGGYIGIAIYALIIKKNAYKIISTHVIGAFILLISYKVLCNYYFGDSVLKLEKHPPMLDWIIYGVIITDLLLLLARKISSFIRKSNIINLSVLWFSVNSFYVYFIHAWLIIMMKTYISITDYSINIVWWLKFVIVFTLSVLIKILYDKVLKAFKKIEEWRIA